MSIQTWSREIWFQRSQKLSWGRGKKSIGSQVRRDPWAVCLSTHIIRILTTLMLATCFISLEIGNSTRPDWPRKWIYLYHVLVYTTRVVVPLFLLTTMDCILLIELSQSTLWVAFEEAWHGDLPPVRKGNGNQIQEESKFRECRAGGGGPMAGRTVHLLLRTES